MSVDISARLGLMSSFLEHVQWAETFDRLLFLSVFLLICFSVKQFNKSRSKYPPGPIGLPIVGYAPFLKKFAHLQFIELGKKYGDVFSLQLGSRFVVVLNSANAIREGYTKHEFQGRPQHNAFAILKKISPYFKSENDVWTEHRRLFVQSMKDLGMGKSRMEQHIQSEIGHFLSVLRSYSGYPVDLNVPLSPSVSNILGALIFNERYDYDCLETKEMLKNMDVISEALDQTSSHIFFPWLQYISFMLETSKREKATKASRDNIIIFRNKTKQHENNLDPKNIRDYIDLYLVEMKSRKQKNFDTTLSDDALLGSLGDIYGAGSETTKTALLWIAYTMAAYPDVQKKVQQEILDHIGTDRTPEYMDIKVMPYTHAVIMEVMRWKSLATISPLRSATQDATLRGYYIPKGTIVMANIWNAHHDPMLWEDPDVFMPERFLSGDGNSVKKSPNLMPYAIGKRSCPGEVLANMKMFLYFVSILQAFDVSFPRGMKPTFDAVLTLVYKPKTYLVQFTPRDSFQQ